MRTDVLTNDEKMLLGYLKNSVGIGGIVTLASLADLYEVDIPQIIVKINRLQYLGKLGVRWTNKGRLGKAIEVKT